MPIDANRLAETIVATKRMLRAQLPTYAETFAEVEAHIRGEAEEIQASRERGESVIPTLDYAAVISGQVSPAETQQIRRRGAVVIRQVFPREQAAAWNQELGEYVMSNGYYEAEADPTLDQYFSTLVSARPQIFGIYWSRPQVFARQAESLAAARVFLNSLWISGRDGEQYFDPRRECTYADRIRRREPGDTTLGLSPHMDAGSVERWLDPAYRQVYRHVFSGNWRAYDPFDGAYRTAVQEIPSPAVCSMFRTYQGWTALTPQGPNDGTLQVVPITIGVAYMLLRALQDDVPEEVLCGAQPARALSATTEWHKALLAALSSIPPMEPGDTIWWHPDLLHAVEDRHAGTGYSNVMYIGAAPYCAKNAAYLERQKQAFLNGESAPDFAPENYEIAYQGRATMAELTELGKRQMGFASW
ncbi:MAG TPA: YbiU family protein [Blastocatellia bacterium]|nr:YbiU family protein [Blastocatellia bacterium]